MAPPRTGLPVALVEVRMHIEPLAPWDACGSGFEFSIDVPEPRISAGEGMAVRSRQEVCSEIPC